MALPAAERTAPRAVIFELESTLLDRRPAWQYAVEQAVGTVCHRRISAKDLAEEYAERPIMHVLGVLVDDFDTRVRCALQWRHLYYRSAMKKLTIHDGVSMMLDRMMHRRIELGVISHEPHALARKQLESTGLDRFLTVLAAQPEEEEWNPRERLTQCATFVEQPMHEICVISRDMDDLATAEEMGAIALRAGWAGGEEAGIEHPSHTLEVIRRAWEAAQAEG